MRSFKECLLHADRLEAITLFPIEFNILNGVPKLLLQARDVDRGLALFLLPSRTKASRGASVAPPLLIGNLGSSLNVNRYLHIMSLLALDRHKLYAALARRSHRNHATITFHRTSGELRFRHV